MRHEAIERQLLAIQNQINANLHAIERDAVNENRWWMYHQLVSIRTQIEAIQILMKDQQQGSG